MKVFLCTEIKNKIGVLGELRIFIDKKVIFDLKKIVLSANFVIRIAFFSA
jgi:hypothetical protein